MSCERGRRRARVAKRNIFLTIWEKPYYSSLGESKIWNDLVDGYCTGKAFMLLLQETPAPSTPIEPGGVTCRAHPNGSVPKDFSDAQAGDPHTGKGHG